MSLIATVSHNETLQVSILQNSNGLVNTHFLKKQRFFQSFFKKTKDLYILELFPRARPVTNNHLDTRHRKL